MFFLNDLQLHIQQSLNTKQTIDSTTHAMLSNIQLLLGEPKEGNDNRPTWRVRSSPAY